MTTKISEDFRRSILRPGRAVTRASIFFDDNRHGSEPSFSWRLRITHAVPGLGRQEDDETSLELNDVDHDVLRSAMTECLDGLGVNFADGDFAAVTNTYPMRQSATWTRR